MYRVRIEGPSASTAFSGGDVYLVESPTDVTDLDGVLIVKLPAFAGRPASDRHPARKPSGPSQVIYPRGGWDKITIVELLDDNLVPNPTQDAR